MYNYFMLIGKKKGLKKLDENFYELSLKVVRPFREADGTFKSDEFKIKCSHWMFFEGENTLDNVKTLSVTGRCVPTDNGVELIANKMMIMGEN